MSEGRLAQSSPAATPAARTAFPDAAFAWPLRVYYEDTDAAGVVYYANYLRFIERARTEWLRALGFELNVVERDYGRVFVVRHADIDFLQPARLGDALTATVAVREAGRSRLILHQDVLREAQVLVRASVTLACLDTQRWRPAAMPPPLQTVLEAHP
ncbi:MAG: tol-pal system-associated acyl-CoA thioesterase [Betaproteobacteria bacterium]|nr:tol-pal system-associated acyl-CoA thioesterase [Betaproteobacteria bacterium]